MCSLDRVDHERLDARGDGRDISATLRLSGTGGAKRRSRSDTLGAELQLGIHASPARRSRATASLDGTI